MKAFVANRNISHQLLFDRALRGNVRSGDGGRTAAKRQGLKYTQGIFHTSCFLLCKKTGSEI